MLTLSESVLAMALFAYSLVGASLTPALLAAFLWKRVTPQGGVACIAGGMGSILGIAALDRVLRGLRADPDLLGPFAFEISGTVFDLASTDYIVIPGVLTSVSLLVIVSLLTPASPREKWAPFFSEPGA